MALGAATVVPAMAVAQAGASCGPLAGLVAADAALHKALCTKGDLDLAMGWVRRHREPASSPRSSSSPMAGMSRLARPDWPMPST